MSKGSYLNEYFLPQLYTHEKRDILHKHYDCIKRTRKLHQELFKFDMLIGKFIHEDVVKSIIHKHNDSKYKGPTMRNAILDTIEEQLSEHRYKSIVSPSTFLKYILGIDLYSYQEQLVDILYNRLYDNDLAYPVYLQMEP